MSHRVLELAVDELSQQPTKVLFNEGNKTSERNLNRITIERHEVIKNGEVTVSTTTDPALVKHDVKILLDKIHHQLESSEAEKTVLRVPPNTQDEVVKTWVFQQASEDQSLGPLTSKILLAILMSGLFAIIMAYWLSARFNRPLQELNRGFKRLSAGHFDADITPQGVNEIKQVILQFNQMQRQLKSLAEIEQQNRELAHLAELGEVSKGLAHALRNPMHTIGLSIEKLENNGLTAPQQRQLTEQVKSKISHINKTISALLRLTTQGIDRTQTLPLFAVIQDVILELKSTEQANFSFDITAVDKKLAIEGDESEVRSIIHTLLVNACEASNAGDTITLSLQQSDNSLQTTFVVADQGSGVASDIEQQLFSPHVSSKPEGAGMGLYIAKRIISLYYRGTITLQNNANQGCTATAIFYNE